MSMVTFPKTVHGMSIACYWHGRGRVLGVRKGLRSHFSLLSSRCIPPSQNKRTSFFAPSHVTQNDQGDMAIILRLDMRGPPSLSPLHFSASVVASALQTALFWKKLHAQHVGAGMRGTPRGRRSICEPRDSSPTLPLPLLRFPTVRGQTTQTHSTRPHGRDFAQGGTDGGGHAQSCAGVWAGGPQN